VADAHERKADLDKDGIVLDDPEKVELDKEGISLKVESSAPVKEDGPAAETPQETAAKPAKKRGIPFPSWMPWPAKLPWKRPEMITIPALASGAACLVLVLVVAGFSLYHALAEKPVVQTVKISQPQQDVVLEDDGRIVLDPFMVFSDTRNSRTAGVIIAQVSLRVDPDAVPNIVSRLFDIRSIIFRRLVATANVYSESEILRMISKDLEGFHIGRVSFLHYQAK
jgi:hypothetical protein